MKPRERAGQVSIARAAPAGHSAPMPMPSSARKRNSRKKLGAKPARKLQTEYQAIEIISGVLRTIRSASHPLAVAPKSRIHSVIVNTAFFFQAEDGIRDLYVTGVQTCALPIFAKTLADAEKGKHDCKGKNDCKGQGGC